MSNNKYFNISVIVVNSYNIYQVKYRQRNRVGVSNFITALNIILIVLNIYGIINICL